MSYSQRHDPEYYQDIIASLKKKLADAQADAAHWKKCWTACTDDHRNAVLALRSERDTARGLLRDILYHVQMADQVLLRAGLQVTAHELRQLLDRITAALKEGTNAGSGLPKLKEGTIYCPACRCLAFVRRNNSIVAHYAPNQLRCPASEQTYCECRKVAHQVCDICQGTAYREWRKTVGMTESAALKEVEG